MGDNEVTEEEVCVNIQEVLTKVKGSLERLDIEALAEWSDHTIHSSFIFQDKRAIYVAIIAYSLAKLLEKQKAKHIDPNKFKNFVANMLKAIMRARDRIKAQDFKSFDKQISNMLNLISGFDKEFTHYVKHVLDFSRVQKGAKMHEHGISLATVAKIMGVSKWDLMKKVGETKTPEHKFFITKNPRQRLKELELLSKKKKKKEEKE